MHTSVVDCDLETNAWTKAITLYCRFSGKLLWSPFLPGLLAISIRERRYACPKCLATTTATSLYENCVIGIEPPGTDGASSVLPWGDASSGSLEACIYKGRTHKQETEGWVWVHFLYYIIYVWLVIISWPKTIVDPFNCFAMGLWVATSPYIVWMTYSGGIWANGTLARTHTWYSMENSKQIWPNSSRQHGCW